MPPPSAGSVDATIVEGAGQSAKIGQPSCLQCGNDRQHVGCERIGLGSQSLVTGSGRLRYLFRKFSFAQNEQ